MVGLGITVMNLSCVFTEVLNQAIGQLHRLVKRKEEARIWAFLLTLRREFSPRKLKHTFAGIVRLGKADSHTSGFRSPSKKKQEVT